MKNIFLLSLLFVVGCANNKNGPLLLKTGVSFGTQYALLRNPAAKPPVEASAAIICATVHGTNVSPAAIVAAVNQYGQQTPESLLIINAAINLYSLTYNGLKETNTAAASPYAHALCDGLVEALAFSTFPAPQSNFRNNVPSRVDSHWPQVR